MNDELTTRLSRELHDQVEGWHDAPLTLESVRGRARSIRRTRRLVAAGAVAAAVGAIAVPTALVGADLSGRGNRELPPVTNTPSEAAEPTPKADGSFPLTLDVPEGEPPATGYLVPGEQQLVTPSETYDLPGDFVQIAPYDGGWVGIRAGELGPFGTEVVVLDGDLEEVSATRSAPSLARSADGSRLGWVEAGGDGADWTAVNAPADGGEPIRTPVPAETVPEGFLAEDTLALSRADGATGQTSFSQAGPDGQLEERSLAGFQSVGGVSEIAGLVAGQTEFRGDSTCSEVRRTDPAGEPKAWGTCEFQLGTFSPDGTALIGYASYYDFGSPTLTVLDATSGTPLVEFSSSRSPRGSAVVLAAAWEDDDTVLALVDQSGDQSVLRLGLDGTAVRTTEVVETRNMSVGYFLPQHLFGQ